MNRFATTTWVCAVALHLPAIGRAQDELPADLHAMKTPSSPAFVALGVSPKEVQRPTTPTAFATDVVSKFRSEGNSVVIPQGLAVEVAPYWLVPQYELTFQEYGNERFESIYRNATFSLATTATPEKDSDGTDLSVGFRTTVLHPALSKAQQACAVDIHREMNIPAKAAAVALDTEVRRRASAAWADRGGVPTREAWERLRKKKPLPPQPPVAVAAPTPPSAPAPGPGFEARAQQYKVEVIAYEQAVQTFNAYVQATKDFETMAAGHEAVVKEWGRQLALLEENLEAYGDEVLKRTKEVGAELDAKAHTEKVNALTARGERCLKVINARGDGLSIDVAGAMAWTYPDGQVENGKLKTAMAWGTLAYDTGGLSALGMVRYIREASKEGSPEGADLGLRLIYASGRFGLSGELVHRTIEDAGQRYSVSLDYRALGDSWVSLTLGKDYGEDNQGGLLALVNVQFNVDTQTLKSVAEQQVKPAARN